MKVTGIKTRTITKEDASIYSLLDEYLTDVPERSVVAVTSKVVSICEGRIVPIEGTDKDELIAKEAQLYLPRELNAFNITITIAHNVFAAGAGIDESNGNGYYVLWPKDPQKSANMIREYVKKKFSLHEVGIVITDSKSSPLRWGVTGLALAHSGFQALHDYVGKPDIFGRPFAFEKVNVMDSLASSAVFVMGEGAEQIPLAIVSDIPSVVFQDRNPTDEELDELHIDMDSDLYGSFLKNAPWKKGKKE